MSQQNLVFVYLFLAYISLHGLLMVTRLPFSKEKLARLKAWGLGVAFLAGTVILGFAADWLMNSAKPWVDAVTKWNLFFGLLGTFCLLALVIGIGVIAFSLLLGHMAALITSWFVSDSEQEFRS